MALGHNFPKAQVTSNEIIPDLGRTQQSRQNEGDHRKRHNKNPRQNNGIEVEFEFDLGHWCLERDVLGAIIGVY